MVTDELARRKPAQSRPVGLYADAAAAITRRAFGGGRLRRKYLAGETVADIAASMGLHPTRIDQILREAITKIRAAAG